ncbi:phosphatase PAP2 family protein [Nakamurella flavida]|uniref:Phosphatase PAP2 family protein n=1 Tax=Nakamurella flavida TaxID=363630 RepID=A0A938YMP4_9ACTN|nr:phosphatase PAP2 family protein [Nakamurella flavida]MBM9475883.1 phosphatase PAP2 family protein [Nakamurella flavida]MDP9777832.1 undecaprenyl-diphosphatase [Nakamurella flavida]
MPAAALPVALTAPTAPDPGTGPDQGFLATYGFTWLPYAAAALVLLGLGLVIAIRNRRARPALLELLLTRGAVLAVIAVSVGALADQVAEGDGLTSFDRPVWQWFVDHRTGFLTGVARTVTTVGSTLSMGVLAGVTVIVLWVRGRRPDAVVIAVVALGAGLLVRVGKTIVGRVRPPVAERLVDETNQSFPSGHSLASMAILGVLVIVLVRLIPSPAGRIAVRVVAVLFIALIGLSRLYLGVHWSTDVLGGWLTGAGWLVLCLTVRRLWRIRRTVQRAALPDDSPADPTRSPRRTDQA